MRTRNRLIKIVVVWNSLLMILEGMISGCSNLEDASKDNPLDTATPEPTPGLVVYGDVRDSNGVGLANVDIYRSYSAYPGELIATTDPDGHYESDFYYIPGDEMVTVYAKQAGLEFKPEYYYWRHYYGNEKVECDFSVQNLPELPE